MMRIVLFCVVFLSALCGNDALSQTEAAKASPHWFRDAKGNALYFAGHGIHGLYQNAFESVDYAAHLDNMVGARRLWIAGGEFGRTRQARGLVSALQGAGALVLGADLNSWFGFHDGAYRTAAAAFPETAVTDRRGTFHGMLRLDHLFFRLDEGWRAKFARADNTFGSDHYPLVGEIQFD